MTWKNRAIELWQIKKQIEAEGKDAKQYSWTRLPEILQAEYPDAHDITFDSVRQCVRNSPEYKQKQSTIHKIETHRKTVMLYKGDGSFDSEDIICATQKDISDKTFLLMAHGFSPEEWELAWAKNSIYNVQLKGGITETYYASKITVKPKTTPDPETMLRRFIEEAPKYSSVQPRTVTHDSDGNLLLVNITDLHLGQLSWGAESGDNYDYKIASQNMKNLIEDIIKKSKICNYSKIALIIGNDFFNIDNLQGTTTKGTQQCNDVRWPKMFDVGCSLLVWAVDAIAQAFKETPIEVILCQGNHDTTTMYAAARYLWAWFNKDESITFDISPKLHKGFAFGNTALLFTHGQDELKNLDWVYTEFRHLVGQTMVTEIHAGHEHKVKVEEKNGVIVFKNPSPAALSAWAYGKGYNSVSQAISRIYDKNEGLVYEIHSKV